MALDLSGKRSLTRHHARFNRRQELKMEKSKKITLNYPAQLTDRLLTEIIVRRPTLGDVLDFPQDGSLKAESGLIARLCNLNEEDLRKIDQADYDKLQDQLLFFRGFDPAGLRKKNRLPDLDADRLGA